MKYPFSPEILDAMPEALAELFRGLELTLLREIAVRLMISDNLNEVTVQDIRALRSHGIDLPEIEDVISKVTKTSKKKLDRLLDDVVKRNQRYYNWMLTIADVTTPQVFVGDDFIEAVKEQTWGSFENITGSMGFYVDRLIPVRDAFIWALDSAVLEIESSAISYTEAIGNATRKLADSGLEWVEYPSGWRNRVDVAVRRAAMTGVSQINRKYDEQSMRFLETDLVEVSAHAGARDKGVGFVNHKDWQGKVYRWDKYTAMFPNASSGSYPDFETTCGLGDVRGIIGANCRHSFHAFVEDVMERTYTDAELQNIDKPPFTYEGKTYTTYEATQKQREIESAVRHWKRREAAAITEEERLTAQARQRVLKAKYREFSNAAGLRTQEERMKAYIP